MTVRRGIPRAIARALVAASACVCACGAQDRGPGRLGAGDTADAFVRAHNARRKAAGLSPLAWSTELEQLARQRARRLAADGCRFSHPRLPANVGENLFRIERDRPEEDAPPLAATPEQVVGAWAAEERDFDYARNRCAPGKQCTHYTQIMWASTRELGCGAATCPSGGQLWVCDYRPAGNILGQRPY